MWDKNGIIFSCIGMIFVMTAPSHGSHEPVDFYCGRGKIVQGQDSTYTVKSICGDDYGLYVYGIKNGTTFSAADFPVELSVYVKDEFGVETPKVISIIQSPTQLKNDNLTDFVPTEKIDIQVGECDNREASVHFGLVSTVNRELNFTTRVARRIWCDFSGVNLKLTSGSPDLPEIYLDDTKNNLNQAMLTSEFNIMVTASNTGDTLPYLYAPNVVPDALTPRVFAVAYIKKYRPGMVLTQSQCETSINHTAPNITAKDVIVAVKHFKDDDDLNTLDLFQAVKDSVDKLDLCGEYVLILQLDPLSTLWNEVDRCDNFLAFRINSTQDCSKVPSRCEVIENAWTDGDMRAVFRGNDKTTMRQVERMFQLDVNSAREVEDHQWNWQDNIGHGRLNILSRHIQDIIANDPTKCPNDADLAGKLQEMEGDTDSSDDTLDALPTAYTEAKEKVKALRDGTIDADTVMAEMNQKLTDLLGTSSSTFLEKMEAEVAKRTIEALLAVAGELKTGMTDGKMNHCDLPERLEETRVMRADDPQMAMESIIPLAGDLVYTLITNPGLPCLENMLKRFLKYATDAEMTEDLEAKFLFDDEDRAEEDSLNECGKPNKCITKMRRMCETEHVVDWEDLVKSREEICKLNIMKATAKNLYKTLGMRDLHGKLKEDEEKEGKYCSRDPLKPRNGPGALWKTMTDPTSQQTYILRGVPNMDNTKLSWTKKAMCSCSSCGTSGMDDGTGSMTTDNPMTKNRRRK